MRYVQDKVRPGTGREGALGYERYIADEHMDVRRDCVSFARAQESVEWVPRVFPVLV